MTEITATDLIEFTAYDQACELLRQAADTDAVQGMRNKAKAMLIYARMAKNRDLEINAAQIRVRAERRLGQMILEQKATVGLATGGLPYQSDSTCSDAEQVDRVPTLKEAGIDRKLSSRAQRTAEIGDIRFEALMAMLKTQAQGDGRVVFDVLKVDQENEQRTKRRDLARAMSDATVGLAGGRKVACIYADPAWKRKQGITDRSYENHYPTMTWDEICAMPVADRLLPDAWGFLWIPRAHMFALHKVRIEVMVVATGEMVLAEVEMPLAWCVAKAWGFDSYSTAYVWTKTDEEHPDDIGGGVLVRDQDEILLQFKRGRGLPKPASSEKYTSNHRERKREHSRKPDHYREMIVSMTGGVPVLELFARVDAEHPLPADWEAWGNQSQTEDAAPCAKPADVDAAPLTVSPDAAAPDAESLDAGSPTTTICSTAPNLISECSTDPIEVSSAMSLETALPLSELQTLRMIASSEADRRHVVAASFVDRGLAFEVEPGNDIWCLTSEGWAYLAVLDDEQAAAEQSDSGMFNAEDAATNPLSDEDAAYGALSAEVAGMASDVAAARDVGWEFQAGPGWKMRQTPYDRTEHKALGFVAAGGDVSAVCLDDLQAKKLIVGKASPKLTKAGKARLQELDAYHDHQQQLAALPSSIQQLVGLYGVHLFKFDKAVVAADAETAKAERDMLELLQERANGDKSFGMACDDSLAERLRAENRSPIGDAPMWRQRGLFELVIDDVRHLVQHDENGGLSVHAVEAGKPFLSETGFRSFLRDYALGATVAEQAEYYIREAIGTVGDAGGKPKKRTKPMPTPASVYRLPAPNEPFEAILIEAEPGVDLGARSVRADALVDDIEPEIVDGVTQCRMPLSDEEFEQRRVLAAIVSGQDLLMGLGVRAEITRDLIGGGLVRVDPANHHLELTDDGKDWLRRRVDAPNYMAAD